MMKSRTGKTLCIRRVAGLVVLLSGLVTTAWADYRILHHFAGGSNDGAGPMNKLVQSGSTLYGMTPQGGGNNVGTVFCVNTDGTDFKVLHSFIGAGTDGSAPYGALLLSGSTLYGMASCTDTASTGTIFALNTDGTGFQILHTFTTNEGKWPYGTLIQSGSMLYGLTGYGGNNNGSGMVGGGTMFRLNVNGTGFEVLHTFTLTDSDGWSPHGSLVQSGTSLYGATTDGGINRNGTVFRSNLDGSGFALLHRFTGGSSDGHSPGDLSTLVISGSTLYGMTREGGSLNKGTVYSINTDGSGFRLLHTFTGGADDGDWPISGTLVSSGSTLYGMTPQGGSGNLGTVFRMNTDGSGFQLLHRFIGPNGSRPYGSLLLSGSTLYGMTTEGGNSNKGVIFALDLPQPKRVPEEYATIQGAVDAAQTGDVIQVAPGTYHENIQIVARDVTLQSTDADDPNVTARTIIEGNGVDPVVKLQSTAGQCTLAGLTIRRGGTGLWCSGGQPVIRSCRIVENAGPGIELLNGAKPSLDHCIIAANSGYGLKLPRGGSATLVNCTITQNLSGGLSGGAPAVRNSILYFNGPSQTGPENVSSGALVTCSCVQGGFTGAGNIGIDPLFACLGRWTDANDASRPIPAWVPGDYHLQSEAGRWDANTTTWVRDGRTSPCLDAGDPNSDYRDEPLPNGGRINMGAYGGTLQAGKSTSAYRVLHHFAGGTSDGSGPQGGLIQSGSALLGMTGSGGGSNKGTLFRINPDGTDFQLLHSFVSGGSDGSVPFGLLLESGPALYGLTSSLNDASYQGTLFRMSTDGTSFQVMHRFAGGPGDGGWPHGTLIQSGSELHGMTASGGNGGGGYGGTIFKVNADGTNYRILHNFAGGGSDGQWAPGDLTRSGSILYGMTYNGGNRGDNGTVFKINTDGTGFQLLRSFSGGSNDGAKPHGSLLLSGSMLYGMTSQGGIVNLGTIFKLNADGTGFLLLHSFAGGAGDGASPFFSSFVQSGSVLYGMTPRGGASNLGIVFQINTDGMGFTVLHTFTGADGSKPASSLLLSGSTLYGMTSEGGSNNLGVIFALDVPAPAPAPSPGSGSGEVAAGVSKE